MAPAIALMLTVFAGKRLSFRLVTIWGFFGILLFGLVVYTQFERFTTFGKILQDGSMYSRLVIPYLFLTSDLQGFLIGGGTGVSHAVNEFSLPILFDTGRHWIYEYEGRLGASPLFLYPACYGALGMLFFISALFTIYGREGAKMIIVMPLVSVFLTGFNTAAAVVPLMLVLGVSPKRFIL